MSKERSIKDLLSDPDIQTWLEEETRKMDTKGTLRYLYDAKVCMDRRRDFLQRQYRGQLDKIYEPCEYMSIGECKITADGVEYPSIIEYANSKEEWSAQSKIRYLTAIRKAVIMEDSFLGVEYRDARVFSGGFANRYRSDGYEEVSRENINMKRKSHRAFYAWPKDNPEGRKVWKTMSAFSRFLGHQDSYVSQMLGQGLRISSKLDGVEYTVGGPASTPIELKKKPVLKLVSEDGEESFYSKKKEAASFLNCDPAQISRAIKNGKMVKGHYAFNI